MNPLQKCQHTKTFHSLWWQKAKSNVMQSWWWWNTAFSDVKNTIHYFRNVISLMHLNENKWLQRRRYCLPFPAAALTDREEKDTTLHWVFDWLFMWEPSMSTDDICRSCRVVLFHRVKLQSLPSHRGHSKMKGRGKYWKWHWALDWKLRMN